MANSDTSLIRLRQDIEELMSSDIASPSIVIEKFTELSQYPFALKYIKNNIDQEIINVLTDPSPANRLSAAQVDKLRAVMVKLLASVSAGITAEEDETKFQRDTLEVPVKEYTEALDIFKDRFEKSDSALNDYRSTFINSLVNQYIKQYQLTSSQAGELARQLTDTAKNTHPISPSVLLKVANTTTSHLISPEKFRAAQLTLYSRLNQNNQSSGSISFTPPKEIEVEKKAPETAQDKRSVIPEIEASGFYGTFFFTPEVTKDYKNMERMKITRSQNEHAIKIIARDITVKAIKNPRLFTDTYIYEQEKFPEMPAEEFGTKILPLYGSVQTFVTKVPSEPEAEQLILALIKGELGDNPTAQQIQRQFEAHFADPATKGTLPGGKGITPAEGLRRVALSSFSAVMNDKELAEKVLDDKNIKFVDTPFFKMMLHQIEDENNHFSEEGFLATMLGGQEVVNEVFSSVGQTSGMDLKKASEHKVSPGLALTYLEAHEIFIVIQKMNPDAARFIKEQGLPLTKQEAFTLGILTFLDPDKKLSPKELYTAAKELSKKEGFSHMPEFLKNIGITENGAPITPRELFKERLGKMLSWAHVAYLIYEHPFAAAAYIGFHAGQLVYNKILSTGFSFLTSPISKTAASALGNMGVLSKVAGLAGLGSKILTGPMGFALSLGAGLFSSLFNFLMNPGGKVKMNIGTMLLLIVGGIFILLLLLPVVALTPAAKNRNLIATNLGGATFAREYNSQFIQVTKTVDKPSFPNNDAGKVTFTIVITAKTDLTNIKVTDSFTAYGKTALTPPPPPTLANLPTSLGAGESTQPITFEQDLSQYKDAIVGNTVSVTADTQAASGQNSTATATVVIGKPPTYCFDLPGWKAADLALEMEAIGHLQATQPTYMAKLCAGGKITLSRDVSSPNGWAGKTESGSSIIIYDLGLHNPRNTFYTFSHETGHIFQIRNSDTARLFSDTIKPMILPCTYRYSTQYPAVESFSETVAEYAGAEALHQDCMNGTFQQTYPTLWQFAHDNIF